jgi:hypothetical protein
VVAVWAALNAVEGMNAVGNGVQVWFAVRDGVRWCMYVVRRFVCPGMIVAGVPVRDAAAW